MSVVHGKNVFFEVEDQGIFKFYACGRSCTFNADTEVVETSIIGSGDWATYLPTKHSATATIDGVVNLDEPGKVTYADLQNKQFSKTLFRVKYTREDYNGNQHVNDFECYIVNCTDSGSYNDVNTFTVTMQITGQVLNYASIGTGPGGGGGGPTNPGNLLELEQGGIIELEQGGGLEVQP